MLRQPRRIAFCIELGRAMRVKLLVVALVHRLECPVAGELKHSSTLTERYCVVVAPATQHKVMHLHRAVAMPAQLAQARVRREGENVEQ